MPCKYIDRLLFLENVIYFYFRYIWYNILIYYFVPRASKVVEVLFTFIRETQIKTHILEDKYSRTLSAKRTKEKKFEEASLLNDNGTQHTYKISRNAQGK